MKRDLAKKTSGVKLGRGRRPAARKLRDAKDALYREHIMDVAEKIFADQGFAATRMQDIAAAAGVSLGTLYQSWPGKQDLHRGLLIERDKQMLERVVVQHERSLQVPQSVEQMLWFMETHLHFLLEHPNYLRMQLQEGYAWYTRAAQPTAEEQRMWDRGMKLMESTFAWGIRQGWLSPANVVHQSRALMAMQQMRLANWVMDGMREPREAVVSRIQSDYVRLFCRPEVAAKLLSADGAGLADATLRRIRAMKEAA
jgi:AcrR family transcriptional regulator